MKKFWTKAVLFAGLWLLTGLSCIPVQAAVSDTIKTGVYADDIDLSGMTTVEARAAVQSYVETLGSTAITLEAADNHTVTVTAAELGISWGNPELADEAAALGTEGNVIRRYKALKDLERDNYVFPIELEFDVEAINSVLTEKCTQYDQKAVNASLTRENGVFIVVDGQIGYALDVEASIDTIYEYLTTEWNREPCSIALDIEVEEPQGTAEDLAQVKDVLGTFTTSYSTSGSSRSANVQNGCSLINGTTLYPGEEFSTYETVSPFSVENGYYMAGSYLNGKVVDSLGGGICQVSTTLYNAVLLSELEVTERYNHSMIVTYVDPSADAAIAESSGKDFKFVNSTDYPIYIEGYTQNKQITFTIYGVETRADSHQVKYESEVLEVTQPGADVITADASQPIGYIVTSGAHTGYKARLWKITYENGVEVSREQVNSSTYKATARSATVGVATADENAYNQIMAAIATSSIDQVNATIAALTTPQVTETEGAESAE